MQRVLAHGQYVMGLKIKELQTRLAVYGAVKDAISCSSGTDALLMPCVAPACTSVWAPYSVLSEHRELLLQKLQEALIPTAIYYPLPLRLQRAFAHLVYKPGGFSVSENTSRRIFSLPLHP
jgi:UDP-2-acetamido-2-deoxy-ribo-hexuluronate aminotransferase